MNPNQCRRESEPFPFYRIPKILLNDPKYRKLSSDAALLYGLLLDRVSLSVRNQKRFTDSEKHIFVYFTLTTVCKTMKCGHDKATKLFGELEMFDLIARVRQGKGSPCRIYVQQFM